MKDRLYFENLDTMRFIAATMVFLGHGIKPSFEYLKLENPYLIKILYIVCNGGIGVSIFFVLSGFLITYLLLDELTRTSTINIWNFYVRRALRIFPLYYLLFLITFGIYPLWKLFLGTENLLEYNFFYHLVFLTNFDLIRMVQGGGIVYQVLFQSITWSVAVEVQFYIIWPLILFFTPKRFLFGSIVIVLAGALIFQFSNLERPDLLYWHSLSVLVDIVIGAGFAYSVHTSKKLKFFFENASGLIKLLLIAISFSLLYWDGVFFDSEYGYIFRRFFVAVSFAMVICSQAFTAKDSWLNFKNFSFANKWGKYSYGIYMLHPIVLVVFGILVKFVPYPINTFSRSLVVCVLAFILTLWISKLSFHRFENLFLKLKDSFPRNATAKSKICL